MKRRLLFLIVSALLLYFTVNLTACGNTSASIDTAGTETKETGCATVPYGGEDTPPETDGKEEDPPALKLVEPVFDGLPDEVRLIYGWDYIWSGSAVNAEGETLYLDSYSHFPDKKHTEDENTMDVLGVKEITTVPTGSVTQYTVKYSDSFTVTVDDGTMGFAYSYDIPDNREQSTLSIDCTEGENVELTVERAGEKITLRGNDLSYRLGVPLYYYRTDVDINYGNNICSPYISSLHVAGRTDGTVTLEKKEDGWYLDGADGEITLAVWRNPERAPDPESNPDVYEYIIPLEVTPNEVIHIEEHIPEVQELYK